MTSSANNIIDSAKLSTAQVEGMLNTFDFDQLPKPGANKGERGQILESALGIKNGSDLTDMTDGELKTFTVGESIAITSLGHCLPDIIDNPTSFKDSKVFQKLKQTIFAGFDKKDGTFIKSKTINQVNSPECYEKLKEDYNYISSQIRRAHSSRELLHTINGPNGLLQIRTKASKKSDGTYTPLLYKGTQLKNKYMAFFLRASFGKEIVKKDT
tara:strand:+ start:9532 stop:10170 length:639 start_codon:yes stop_codon:yes gene_type:complete